MDRIHLAQDRNQWWTLVNTEMNLRVPYIIQNFLSDWVDEWLLASQEGLGLVHIKNIENILKYLIAHRIIKK
jgi:hypothetical protein